MGTIPAPNIFEDAGQIAQAPAEAMANAARLRALNQQTQQSAAMAPLQQQAAQQQIEAQKRQFADQDALTKAMTQFDPSKHTLADVPKLITQNGGSGQAALNAQAGLVQQRSNLAKLSDEQFAQEQKKADLIQGVHDQVSGAPAEDKQNVYSQGLMTLARAGVDISKESPMYPGDEVFAKHLPAIRLHSAILAEAEKDRELSNKEQEEANKEWVHFPELGMALNTQTGETKSANPGGAPVMTPGMMEAKYVALQAKKNAGQPLSADDAAWTRGYEKYKTLVPVATFNLQAAGVNGTPPATSDANGQPLSYDKQIKSFGPKGGVVKAIIEGRQDPPASFAQKSPYWQDVMQKVYAIDSEFNQQRAQLRKAYTVGQQSKEINAINTAMGHVGVLGDSIDALNNGDVRLLNSVANRLGLEVGQTPQATFKTIVHRVGPELSKAYLGAGGSAGERGSDEKDFDENLAPQTLRSNVGITAKLLRSKIGALENQWDQNKAPSMKSFNDQFISQEAKQQLDKWSPSGGTQAGGNTGDFFSQFGGKKKQ